MPRAARGGNQQQTAAKLAATAAALA